MTAALPAAITIEIPSLRMDEGELVKVLESSIYPGADMASIKLLIGVCRAARLDPLQKPYHIVPMDVKVKLPKVKPTDKDEFRYVKRDVIMPGIGLYRIQAERSGEYAGRTEPEFGPLVIMKWKEKYQEHEEGPELERDVEFAYPEWCRMAVRRMVNGQIVEFAHKEFWIENYATKGRNSKHPNAMWNRRPKGQLAKCTEAQLLRIGFPSIGAQPTAEEMEGKTIEQDPEGNLIDGKTGQVINKGVPPLMANDTANGSAASAAAPANPQSQDRPSGAANATEAGGGGAEADVLLTDGERAHVKAKLAGANLTEVDLKAKFGVDLAALKASQFKPVKAWISNPSA